MDDTHLVLVGCGSYPAPGSASLMEEVDSVGVSLGEEELISETPHICPDALVALKACSEPSVFLLHFPPQFNYTG